MSRMVLARAKPQTTSTEREQVRKRSGGGAETAMGVRGAKAKAEQLVKSKGKNTLWTGRTQSGDDLRVCKLKQKAILPKVSHSCPP